MISQAGIYSDRGGLVERLRAACPDWTFVDDPSERDSCRIAIVDEGVERPAGKSVVRVMLSATPDDTRRSGELRIQRDVFLESASGYLAFAADLADAAIHAAQLEQETAYLRQIHELMTMVDAEAVSERITTTV